MWTTSFIIYPYYERLIYHSIIHMLRQQSYYPNKPPDIMIIVIIMMWSFDWITVKTWDCSSCVRIVLIIMGCA